MLKNTFENPAFLDRLICAKYKIEKLDIRGLLNLYFAIKVLLSFCKSKNRKQ